MFKYQWWISITHLRWWISIICVWWKSITCSVGNDGYPSVVPPNPFDWTILQVSASLKAKFEPMGWPEDIVLDQKEDPSTDHASYDGNPSLLWFTMMDIHPKSVVMDIHAPSRLFCAGRLNFTHILWRQLSKTCFSICLSTDRPTGNYSNRKKIFDSIILFYFLFSTDRLH